MTLTSISAAAVCNSRQKASSSVIEVRCPAMVSERFLGWAKPGSSGSVRPPSRRRRPRPLCLRYRPSGYLSAGSAPPAYAPGLIISSARTVALNSSSDTKPSARASSRSVVPCLWAVLAICAALS